MSTQTVASYQIPQEGFDLAEQKSLFEFNTLVSRDEAFEILDAQGVKDITWDEALDFDYGIWRYFNNK